MMRKKDLILAGFEFVLWYIFICTGLYAIKNPVNIYFVAGLLLITMYAATICCPLVRHSKAWRRLFNKEY